MMPTGARRSIYLYQQIAILCILIFLLPAIESVLLKKTLSTSLPTLAEGDQQDSLFKAAKDLVKQSDLSHIKSVVCPHKSQVYVDRKPVLGECAAQDQGFCCSAAIGMGFDDPIRVKQKWSTKEERIDQVGTLSKLLKRDKKGFRWQVQWDGNTKKSSVYEQNLRLVPKVNLKRQRERLAEMSLGGRTDLTWVETVYQGHACISPPDASDPGKFRSMNGYCQLNCNDKPLIVQMVLDEPLHSLSDLSGDFNTVQVKANLGPESAKALTAIVEKARSYQEYEVIRANKNPKVSFASEMKQEYVFEMNNYEEDTKSLYTAIRKLVIESSTPTLVKNEDRAFQVADFLAPSKESRKEGVEDLREVCYKPQPKDEETFARIYTQLLHLPKNSRLYLCDAWHIVGNSGSLRQERGFAKDGTNSATFVQLVVFQGTVPPTNKCPAKEKYPYLDIKETEVTGYHFTQAASVDLILKNEPGVPWVPSGATHDSKLMEAQARVPMSFGVGGYFWRAEKISKEKVACVSHGSLDNSISNRGLLECKIKGVMVEHLGKKGNWMEITEFATGRYAENQRCSITHVASKAGIINGGQEKLRLYNGLPCNARRLFFLKMFSRGSEDLHFAHIAELLYMSDIKTGINQHPLLAVSRQSAVLKCEVVKGYENYGCSADGILKPEDSSNDDKDTTDKRDSKITEDLLDDGIEADTVIIEGIASRMDEGPDNLGDEDRGDLGGESEGMHNEGVASTKIDASAAKGAGSNLRNPDKTTTTKDPEAIEDILGGATLAASATKEKTHRMKHPKTIEDILGEATPSERKDYHDLLSENTIEAENSARLLLGTILSRE